MQGTQEEPQVRGDASSAQVPEQSWKPASQAKPQMPDAQVAEAFAGAVHAWPQPPQSARLVVASTHDMAQRSGVAPPQPLTHP